MNSSPDREPCHRPDRRQVLRLLMAGGAAASLAALPGCDIWYDDAGPNNPNAGGSDEDGTAYDIKGMSQYDVLAEAYPDGRPNGDLQFKVRRNGSWTDPDEIEFEIDEDDVGDDMWLYRFTEQDEAVLFMIVEDESAAA